MTVHIGNRRIELTEVDSTNNYATQMVSAGTWEPELWKLAHAQPKGKGLLTNKWESEAGKNITMSVLLAPEFLPIPMQFQISKVVSLAVCQVVSMFAPNVSIKWPNDVYIGSEESGRNFNRKFDYGAGSEQFGSGYRAECKSGV